MENIFFVLPVSFIILMIASTWKIFVKAGQPGWASIVPVYNFYIHLKIIGRPGWWLFYFLFPPLGLVIIFIMEYELALAFGQKYEVKFVGLLISTITLHLFLAFGDAQYIGPVNRNKK